jgi:hypothetical protein
MFPEAPESQYASNSETHAFGSLRPHALSAVYSTFWSTRRIVFLATLFKIVSNPVAPLNSSFETRTIASVISKIPVGGVIDI